MGTMWKNYALNTALYAQADPVGYAKANMDTLRATYVVSKAIVTQSAKTIARMKFYGGVDEGVLDKAKGGILKWDGQQHPDAKGISGNVFSGNVWSFSAAFANAAVLGFAGDIEAGTTVDFVVEPLDENGDIIAGNAAPHTFLTRVSAQEAAYEWGAVINGINNLEVLAVGNVIYIIPILAWRAIRCRDMVVTPV